MNKTVLVLSVAAVTALGATAHAQIIGGARENVAGGVTAGGAHDVRGPHNGRAVGEGGVVTNGDGAGIAASRGCGRTAGGGRGCGAASTVRDEDGSISHEHSAYGRGAYGNTASTQGSFERDEDGEWSGERNSQVNVASRTYSVDTTFQSGGGWERRVECSGSGCPD